MQSVTIHTCVYISVPTWSHFSCMFVLYFRSFRWSNISNYKILFIWKIMVPLLPPGCYTNIKVHSTFSSDKELVVSRYLSWKYSMFQNIGNYPEWYVLHFHPYWDFLSNFYVMKPLNVLYVTSVLYNVLCSKKEIRDSYSSSYSRLISM